MKNWDKLLAIAFLLGLVASILPALAQGEISVLVDEYDYEFSSYLYFHLEAEAPRPIEQVYLIYKLGDSPVIHKQAPDFSPGTRINAEWTWELERGSLPPGVLVKYYWRLIADDGTVYKTEPRSFRYEDTRFSWSSLSEGPVTLYWYGDSEDSARELMDAAQQALDRLQSEMGVEVEGPINIYIYASRQDMLDAIPSRSATFDEATVTLGMVLSKDTLVILGSDPDVEKTLAHELSHLVVGKATENPLGAPIPRWLDEGLAMYAEGELPPSNRLALERAIRTGELISVRSLSGYVGDPSKVDLFYAEAYSLVDFLLKEYGKEKMSQLLEKFAEGTYQEDALREVYGFGLDELDARWKEYLGLPQARPQATPAPSPTAQPPSDEQPSPERKPSPCPGSIALGMGAVAGALLLKEKRSRGSSKGS